MHSSSGSLKFRREREPKIKEKGEETSCKAGDRDSRTFEKISLRAS